MADWQDSRSNPPPVGKRIKVPFAEAPFVGALLVYDSEEENVKGQTLRNRINSSLIYWRGSKIGKELGYDFKISLKEGKVYVWRIK